MTKLMPLTEFETLRQTMDRFMDEVFANAPIRTIWSRAWIGMPLDVYATDDQVVIRAALPGIKPENLSISVYENTVTLSGTIAGDEIPADAVWYLRELPTGTFRRAVTLPFPADAVWYLRELPTGTFRRAVTLPFPVDAYHAEATFENGVVRVILPKAASAKPRKIAITSGEQPKAVGAGASVAA